MDLAILTLTFAAAVLVSASVVMAFSVPIDDILGRLITGEMAQAWSRYIKFAVFTASFGGGLRLSEIANLMTQRQAPDGTQPFLASQGLLEIFKTIVGSLGAASWTLLVFFGSTLAIYAASRVYDSFKREAGQPRGGDRHGGAPVGRL